MYLLCNFKEICPTDNILFLVKFKFCIYIVTFQPCLRSVCFPGGSVVESLPANAGSARVIPGWEHPLEQEMATHSSILAWKIPQTEEPGGLQSMGSQKSQM